MLHISLGGKGKEILLPSARTAFRAAPSSHLLPAETLSAERKKSRRLGAISGSNGWLALRRLRQSHLFGSGYPVGLGSKSCEKLCLRPAAVPTVVQRSFARFGRVGSSCAHGAGRGGAAVVPWHGGTDCTCLRPRRSQREATPARCHSRVHSVWDRKKGRSKALHTTIAVKLELK